MAQLAIAVAGAAVGFAVGGPFGAAALGGQIGFVAGSMIGSMAFAPQQDIPKVGDLKPPQVQYGTPLPRLYGSNRTSGTLAWYSTKRVIPGDSGGKGTPTSPTADTAEIDVLYILAYDSAAIGITRIWKNGELVWTNHADSSDASLEASTEVQHWTDLRFLSGVATQLPDPVIEAAEGVGNAPAYRHRQCVLIEGLKLWQSGQMPLLEFEVVTAGTGMDVDAEVTRYAHNVVEQSHDTLLPEGSIDFGVTSRIAVRPPTLYNNVVCHEVYADGTTAVVATDDIPGGFVFADAGLGTGDHALIVLGSADTECKFAAVGDGVSFTATLPNLDNYLGSSEIRFAVSGGHVAVGTSLALDAKVPGSPTTDYNLGNQGRIYVYATADGEYVSTIEAGLGAIESIAMAGATVWALKAGTVYPFTAALTTPVASATIAAPAGGLTSIFASSAGALCGADDSGNVYRHADGAWELLATLVYSATPLGADTVQHGITGSVIYACDVVSVSAAQTYTYWWRARVSLTDSIGVSGTIWDQLEYVVLHDIQNQMAYELTTGGSQRAISGLSYSITQVTPPFVDFADGTGQTWVQNYSYMVLYGYGGDTEPDIFATPMTGWVWVEHSGSYTIDLYRTADAPTLPQYFHDFYKKPLVGAIDPLTVDLADIVSAEWARVDDVAHIDVTELEGIPVRGFQSSGSVRGAYEALAPVFHFGAVCSDKLYFRLEGGASSATIAFDELAAGENQAADEPFAPQRANDLELPERIAISFPNYADDYAMGTETGSRGGAGTIVVAQQTNVVMLPAEAKAVAETGAAQAEISATTAQISLTDYYAALEPTDAITVPDEDGTTYRMRIVRETIGNGVRQLDLVRDDVTALVSPGITTTTGAYAQSLTVAAPPVTEMVLIDTAILRDSDDDAGFYAAAKGFSGGPSRLFSSADGVTYAEELAFTAQSVFGSCSTTLGAWSGGRVFDETSTVTVNVGSGTLSSTTRGVMLSDASANACAIGIDGRWELCQFRTATLVSAGVYTLSGFLRGARGTEWACSAHTSGETFALLTTAARRVSVQNSELGTAEYYKGVSAGKLLSSTSPQTFTDNAVGLHPYAPVNVRVARDGTDATVTWDRRTRLSTRLASSVGISCPLGETSEAYEVDVYASGAFATVVHTITSSTASAAYTGAQQTADGLTPGATLYLRVYQLNEIVGRGYAAEATA